MVHSLRIGEEVTKTILDDVATGKGEPSTLMCILP